MSQFEPGLGKSEEFYSWLVTVLNAGTMIGGLASTVLLNLFPYWHLVLSSLILHTLGYVLYALANSGWIMMLSRLLTGLCIGIEVTIIYSYIGESNINYKKALIELGKNVKKATTVKHRIFCLYSLGNDIGYILGAGKYH